MESRASPVGSAAHSETAPNEKRPLVKFRGQEGVFLLQTFSPEKRLTVYNTHRGGTSLQLKLTTKDEKNAD